MPMFLPPRGPQRRALMFVCHQTWGHSQSLANSVMCELSALGGGVVVSSGWSLMAQAWSPVLPRVGHGAVDKS